MDHVVKKSALYVLKPDKIPKTRVILLCAMDTTDDSTVVNPSALAFLTAKVVIVYE